MPEGSSFPYDYGYVPSTKGGDGDPLDILILMDAAAFPSCVIKVSVIGAIEAEQTERDGRRERNDRLIGVAAHAHTHEHVAALSDLRPQMVGEIEGFFEHYNRLAGKEFKPVRRSDADEAMTLVRQAVKDFEQSDRRSARRSLSRIVSVRSRDSVRGDISSTALSWYDDAGQEPRAHVSQFWMLEAPANARPFDGTHVDTDRPATRPGDPVQFAQAQY